MNEHVWWYTARAGGIVAWVLLAATVAWGLLLSTRLIARRGMPAWLLDLHRFLGALAVVFTAIHVGALVLDGYTDFGARDILVPMASEWKPGAVAWGVVALYLLVAVEVTSLLMRRIPRRYWRAVHLTSFVLFLASGLHGAAAGSDARNALYRWTSVGLIAATMFLTLVRVLDERKARRRGAAARPVPVPEAA